MQRIIVIQNNATGAQLDLVKQMLAGLSGNTPLVIGDGEGGDATLLAKDADSLLIVNAQAGIKAIEEMYSRRDEANAIGMTIFSSGSPAGSSTLPELKPGSLISAISDANNDWAIVAITTESRILRDLSAIKVSNGMNLMAGIIIAAVSELESVDEIVLNDSTSYGTTSLGSREMRASALRLAMEQNNIEDLFPNHSWKLHQEESAAASYHSLAALFIRFGDLATAQSCLDLADSFEDSPRSLALRGVISMLQGEVLTAVANMVSSLQQYETRKRPDETHYLSFTPRNVDAINSELRAGLEALNKKDNKVALQHFAEAVTQFDPFYGQWGVQPNGAVR
jgi:hypothetical protein